MSHSWKYRNDDYSDDEIELTADDSAGDGEPFTPTIKTNLSFDEFDEASANGILLDACAGEILRLDRRIKELEERMLNARIGHNKRVSALEAEPARIRRELLEAIEQDADEAVAWQSHERVVPVRNLLNFLSLIILPGAEP